MIEIVPFTEQHLKDVLELFVANYQRLNNDIIGLPIKYLEPMYMEPSVRYLMENYDAVVALEDGRVISYLCGLSVPHFKSSHLGIYTPEWGHYSPTIDLYNQMFQSLSSSWEERDYKVHAITYLANQIELVNEMFYNNYGMFVIDAVKEVVPVSIELDSDITIEIATEKHLEQIEKLLVEHDYYMMSSPTYNLKDAEHLNKKLQEDFEDYAVRFFIAIKHDEVIGVMKTVENGQNAATIVRDRKTLSIQSTHVKSNLRGLQIGTKLLQTVSNWANEKRYSLLSVDFESANVSARKFWLKHFTPVCYSIIRYLDDRIIMK